MTFTPPALLDPARFAADAQGRPVGLFNLASPGGLRASVCAQGARLLQLLVPGRDGGLRDVVLGHDSLAQLASGIPSMGAFMGRYANRIGHARFTLEGREWQLPANDGDNCIHGGPAGARWQVFGCVAQAADSVTLAWTFREADDGFPGDVALEVTYALRDPGTLAVTWEARVSGRATVLSFTTHPFFNLEGDGQGSPDDHRLWMDAPRVLRIDAGKRPTGELDAVEGTALDFRAGRTLGEAVRALGTGIDHCFVPEATSGLRPLARVQAPGSGIAMEVWSDAPALQLYTGHGLDGSLPRHAGKQGRVYGPGAGFCLEPQQFPDAPNHPNFPSTVVPAGGVQRGRIEHRFSVAD